jgi:hypothetical protein
MSRCWLENIEREMFRMKKETNWRSRKADNCDNEWIDRKFQNVNWCVGD